MLVRIAKRLKRLVAERISRFKNIACHKKQLTSPGSVAALVGQVDEHWRARIDDVVSCPDNNLIPRCDEAGRLEGCIITMHNGVKVHAGGYYGAGILNMLMENGGVHEPQEERIFEEVVRTLPKHCCMLELGSYWGFYSLSLLQQRPRAKCYLVEPDRLNMVSGKLNFRLNGRKAHFTEAAIGAEPDKQRHILMVDAFCDNHSISHLDILHADIQGHEAAMLEGARDMLLRQAVDYVFISSHSNELHRLCCKKLRDFGYRIVVQADLGETFSYDGLIVAANKAATYQPLIDISRRSAAKDEVAARAG